jgi:hypothetical protein
MLQTNILPPPSEIFFSLLLFNQKCFSSASPAYSKIFNRAHITLLLNGEELEFGECCRKSNWI